MTKRRSYPIKITVNGRKISEVVIDPHYEAKHSGSIDDDLILELVKLLNGKFYEPTAAQEGFQYFVADPLEFMAKSKKLKAKVSTVRWPSEKALSEIRDRLSSGEVQGSRVLGPSAHLADRIKQDLCSKIVEYHVRNKVTQKALAEKLGVDEPEMSRILHYKIDRYSIDRLVGYLEILYPNVDFEVFAA